MSRLLEVRLLEARNVIACDRGGTSDPYVVAALVDIAGREVKGEKQKTEKINKTLNPKWNATLQFGTCRGRGFGGFGRLEACGLFLMRLSGCC